jgi:hypothetical protein
MQNRFGPKQIFDYFYYLCRSPFPAALVFHSPIAAEFAGYSINGAFQYTVRKPVASPEYFQMQGFAGLLVNLRRF